MANAGYIDPYFTTRVRVGGSGFTIFTFGGQPITFCQQASHTSPQPVGGGMSAIQPMDEPYPIEIITPAAAGPGQLVLNMFELFGSGGVASKVWDRLGLKIGSKNSPFGSEGPANQSTNIKNLTGNTDGLFMGAVDIVDIFLRQAQADPSQLQIVKVIRPLAASGSGSSTAGFQPYTEEYHGCVITQVQDGEQISIGTMEVLKQITVTYRYMTRNGNPSIAFKVRDNAL
jgi:hypothetical protein